MEVQKEDIFIAEIIFLPSNRISQQSSPRDPRINVKYHPKQLNCEEYKDLTGEMSKRICEVLSKTKIANLHKGVYICA